jgi:hypothetical protein
MTNVECSFYFDNFIFAPPLKESFFNQYYVSKVGNFFVA